MGHLGLSRETFSFPLLYVLENTQTGTVDRQAQRHTQAVTQTHTDIDTDTPDTQ